MNAKQQQRFGLRTVASVWALTLLGLVAPDLASAGQSAAAAPTAKPATSRPALRVLSDIELGEPLKYAVDIRWAGDRSVYLALQKKGVVEYNLDSKKSPTQPLIPGNDAAGGFWISQHVAASSSDLLVGAPAFALSWRSLIDPARHELAFEFLADIDVRGKQVAVLGVRRDATGKFAPDGAIAWTGTLSKQLSDLKPLLYDATGPGAENMNKCAINLIGGTRFLSDGSLVVVPGSQPGIYRYDAKGKLVQTADSVALGLDTDCAAISHEMKSRLFQSTQQRMAWVNERRVLDEILPLPEGPGLLVRSLRNGLVRWELKILGTDGKVSTHDVPIRGKSPFAHLRGDVRQGKILLLLWEQSPDGKRDLAPRPRIVTTALPGA